MNARVIHLCEDLTIVDMDMHRRGGPVDVSGGRRGVLVLAAVAAITSVSIAYIHYGQKVEREVRSMILIIVGEGGQ